jgi:threonine dehydrogenase-like Zn-dependent dehydrogenase
MHSYLAQIDASAPDTRACGGQRIQARSHGESFLAVLRHRFADRGEYFLDEPESALSFRSSLHSWWRIALHCGAGRVIGVDLVTERLERAWASGVDTLNFAEHDDVAATIRDMTDGRGPDSGRRRGRHGGARPDLRQAGTADGGHAARRDRREVDGESGVDRMFALHLAIDTVRRGGTVSVNGVYAGTVDPLPMMTMFDKQIGLRMGQANVRTWVDEIMPLLTDEDPLGVDHFATHRVPLDEAPKAYENFQQKKDRTVKVLLRP